MKFKQLPLVLSFFLIACRGGTQDKLPSECLVGWWSPPADQSCDIGCAGGATFAECQQADCRFQVFEGFTSTGLTFSGAYVSSESLGTFSSVVPMLSGTYQANNETFSVNYDQPSEPTSYTCQGNELVSNFQKSIRIGSENTNVLDAASNSQELTFTSQPFSGE